jgi:type IV secretory pathway TrbF-like protein
MNNETPVVASGAGDVNRYLAARLEWDERYGDLITRAKNWRITAILCAVGMVILSIGMVVVAMKSKIVPYVVAVDSVGKVVSQGPAEQAAIPDDRLKRAALYDWLQDFRMVSSDPLIEHKAIEKVYSMIAEGSAAKTTVSDFYQGASPLERSQKELVTIDIHTLVATSPQTFEVEWTEKTTDLNGNVTATQNWKGAFTLAVNPPTDERVARINPLGIYITNANWSKVL